MQTYFIQIKFMVAEYGLHPYCYSKLIIKLIPVLFDPPDLYSPENVTKPEAVSAFWSGGWQKASEASPKFSPPPCEFSPPPYRGVASFTGGWQQLIH